MMCTPIIPACGKLRQEDLGFRANLGYIARPCLKKRKEKKRKRNHVVSTASLNKLPPKLSPNKVPSAFWAGSHLLLHLNMKAGAVLSSLPNGGKLLSSDWDVIASGSQWGAGRTKR
jgi:hypothetical protein